MSVIYDNVEYDLISQPKYTGYKPSRVAPKVRFQATAGYVQQREQYPNPQKKILIELEKLTDAENNLLTAFLDYIKSKTFYFILPTSLKPRPDGKIYPVGILCRIIDNEIPEEPTNPGFLWKRSLTLESIGPEVTGTPPDE
jgi:hypothetical protein